VAITAFLGSMAILAAYWDEWHSLMQTFGFGRIYDVKVGSVAHIGRKLDMGMCFVLGLLPHLILFTYIPESVKHEGLVRYFELTDNAIARFGHTVAYFRLPLYIFGVSYTLFYIYQYRNLSLKVMFIQRPKWLCLPPLELPQFSPQCFYSCRRSLFWKYISRYSVLFYRSHY